MGYGVSVAKLYKVEYAPKIELAIKAQEAFYAIFSRYEMANSLDNEYDNDYEINRDELITLRDDMANRPESYIEENEEYIKEQLSMANITVEQFVEILNKLITESDPNNEFVVLGWY
ncbi:MAG: hypothetical protein SNJ29_10625 [Rikenellaceae bacterium]